VGTRIKTYGLPVTPAVSAYIERVQALPGIKAWIDDALAEKDFLQFEEPYRTGR
jgi:glutathione S-transferase